MIPKTIKHLPLIEVTDRKRLGLAPVIYFLVKNRKVVYVGQSVNLRQRLINHSGPRLNMRGVGRKNWTRVYYMLASSDADERISKESALIKELDPCYNDGVYDSKKPVGSMPRLILHVTHDEFNMATEAAETEGHRTPQQWALSVILRALILTNSTKEPELAHAK